MKKSTKIFIIFAVIGLFLGICGTVMMTLSYNEDNALALESRRMGLSQLPVWTHIKDGDNIEFNSDITSTSLNIDMSVGDVNIVSGDKFQIETYNFPNDNSISVFEENNVINVVYQDNYIFFPFRSKKNNRITIYVPKSITDIDAHCAVGDINVSNITAANIKLSSPVGDIEMANTTADTVDIKNNTGDVEFKGNFNKSMTVSGDVGDIEIYLDEAFENYDYEVKTNIGNVSVAGSKSERLGGHLSYVNGKNRLLKVNNNVGDISVTFK